ncbi:MAG: hypothetical protein H0W75_07010, partial [Chitinophagaceae bacterium]|nr:hypothetical protein [Chitinophagaceae bacterium]
MKASITFFITVLLAPVVNLQAQSNSNVKHSNSYPQAYFVRTVSGHGIIPTTSVQVIDNEGRSISCSARSRQICKTDSLITSLETCTTCKIVKTKAQLDALYNAMKMGTPECASGYGVPVYAIYTKKAHGSLQ